MGRFRPDRRGLQSAAVWALVGAVCGGLYAYYTEHLLTKDELKRIARRLPGNSSAIVAFVRGTDPRRILSSTASFEPATASVAAIGADLSAQTYSGASNPLQTSATPAGAAPTAAADQTAELSMLLVRFVGEHAARQALGKSGTAAHQDQKAPQVELVIETNEHGRRRVIDPTTGTAAFAKSDTISWGLFGLVWGVIVGFTGDGGVLSSIESGLVTGILWAIFGVARRRTVRPVGGARCVRPPAEEAWPAVAARHLAGGRLGGRPAHAGNDRAVGRTRVAATDPALQPSWTRRPTAGVRTR